jgi:transcriptional regulator with XRE-family HTH domain
MAPLNLRGYRNAAGLSQRTLAEKLGISQAQLSRYESEPGGIPYEILERWLNECGTDMQEVHATRRPVRQIESGGLDAGAPYVEMFARLNLLEQYVEAAPATPREIPSLFDPRELVAKVNEWRQKPTLVLAGRFDSGKSKLANSLLGGSYLPSRWTPTTSVVTFVRHTVEDRPTWQKEDVWIMDEDFKPHLWWDKEHCEKTRIIGGNYDTLWQYGTQNLDQDQNQAIPAKQPKYALVYVNAPILNSCTLVDLPGYNDEQGQEALCNAEVLNADVLIYTSAVTGFLDNGDQQPIGMFLRILLPPSLQENASHENLDPCDGLARLFVIATHANEKITDSELEQILKRGSLRLFKTLGNLLTERSNGKLRPPDLRKRLFPFWFEEPERRIALESDLLTLFSATLPPFVEDRVNSDIKTIKADSKSHLASSIAAYEETLLQLSSAKQRLKDLTSERSSFYARVDTNKKVVHEKIESCKRTAHEHISAVISTMASEKYVQQLLDDKYSGQFREEAKSDGLTALLEAIQTEIEPEVARLVTELRATIESFLDQVNDYRSDIPIKSGTISIPFNARATFLGGITGIGLGTIGNYVFAAKIASLSAIGIGSTTALAFVSALGGPVALVIGLASFASLSIWALIRQPWDTRLAKKLAKTLEEQKLLDKMLDASDSYWAATKKVFDDRVKIVTENFDEYIKHLTKLLEERDREGIERLLVQLDSLQAFFAGIPWRSSEVPQR